MPPRKERKSLLATLIARLRKRRAEPEPISTPRPFQAISIYRGLECCSTARRFSEFRFLAKDAPSLPLQGCSMPKQCTCRYLKHKDRRSERRRLGDYGASHRMFHGTERRSRTGRRGSD